MAINAGHETAVQQAAEGMNSIVMSGFMIPLLPLIAFVIITFFIKKYKMASALVSIIAMAAALVLSINIVLSQIAHPQVYQFSFAWLHLGPIKMDMGVLVNQLTAIMLIVVTTVSLLVQIYSIGYMKGDEGFSRFFSFISLFSFSMLGIVISNNLIQIYIFWELVGLCSYLLIGFWYHKPEAAEAAKKAFVVTRFGDFGFLVGILILTFKAGTFNFLEVQHFVASGGLDPQLLTIVVLLLFCGAVGKSGQFPLHVWLPDAMEGPTPVSALIHAATMVAAGVFMVARLFGIFSLSPDAMLAVAYIGGFTAFFAATIALTQNDIKRILAYSTLSQLGFMMLALGVGGYTAGMFHLFTHAFFKALLFLGAGSVIHAVHTNDIFKMGGLHKKMPITSITFLIAALAIAGIPPLAGFWSKDEIIVTLHASGNGILYWGAVVTAFMTAFYMFRLWFVTFLGEPRDKHAYDHAHESPLVMTAPLMVLALLAITAGLIGMPWLKENIYTFLYHGHPHEVHMNWPIAISSTVVAIAGITLAFVMYYVKALKPETMMKVSGPLYKLSKNKWYMDEIYMFLIRKLFFTASEIIKWFDRHVVDGLVNLFAFLTRFGGVKLKYTFTGRVQNYALVVFAGLLAVVLLAAVYNPDLLRIMGGK